MIQGFSHIGIAASDLDRSRRFYCDVFGFTPLYQLDFADNEVAATMEQEGTFKSAMLVRGDVRIELLQWVDVEMDGGGKKPMTELGFTHLSFRVEDLNELNDAVLAAGGKVLTNTLTVMGADDAASPRLMYVLDPDGTRIELMQNVPDLSRLPGDVG